MGRGNEPNFLTEREARPLIQCAGLEAGGPSAGRQAKAKGNCEETRAAWGCLHEDRKPPRAKRARHTEDLGAATQKAARKEWMRLPRLDQDSCGLRLDLT